MVQRPQSQALTVHHVVVKVAPVCPSLFEAECFKCFLRLSRAGTASFHSHPLYFSSDWYFDPFFKICVSHRLSPGVPQLPSPADPQGASAHPVAPNCLLQGPDLLSFAPQRPSAGSAVPPPVVWSGWLMAVEMLHVGALMLVRLDDPALWIEALALLWYIYSLL